MDGATAGGRWRSLSPSASFFSAYHLFSSLVVALGTCSFFVDAEHVASHESPAIDAGPAVQPDMPWIRVLEQLGESTSDSASSSATRRRGFRARPATSEDAEDADTSKEAGGNVGKSPLATNRGGPSYSARSFRYSRAGMSWLPCAKKRNKRIGWAQAILVAVAAAATFWFADGVRALQMDLEQQRQSEESLQDAAEPQEQPEQQRTSPDETHGPAPHSGLPDAAQAALEPQEPTYNTDTHHNTDSVETRQRKLRECHTIDLIRYWWNLPQLDEMQFPEFGNILRDGRRRHASRFKVVKLVPTVDAALAKFLNLSPSQRAQGIAIKARPNSVLSLLPRWSPVRESYLHTDILPKNRFLWPALGAFVGRRYPALYLVMPRARGDVWEAFKKHPEKFDLPLAIAEIVLAVKALHEAGLVHRDIALSNFYISFSGHIALGDMETVTVEGMRETQASRLGHTAPEVEGNPFTRLGLEYIAYSKKSDMSSLGAALSKFAWDKGKQETEQLILDLAKKLQDTDPARRLDFDEIMQHPLFEGIDFDAVEQGLTPPPFKDSEYTWEGAGFF